MDLLEFKDSPLKMLLTSPTSTFSVNTLNPPLTPPVVTTTVVPSNPDVNEDGTTKLITYYQLSSTGEKESDPIVMDHCYSRPWNWKQETSYIRPTKTLFIPKFNSKTNSSLPMLRAVENKDVIDVESVPAIPAPIYDMDKARDAMGECERHAVLAHSYDGNDEWEDSVPKDNWTSEQTRVFTSIVKILHNDRLARLTYAGTWNEPVLRRAIIDKSVQRVRSLMASISWDTRITQWLHALLIDHLSTSYLGAYLDILQTLKSKLPTFVEKMMFGPNTLNRVGVTSNEGLFPLLKRPWDPIANSLAVQEKPKRLPGNPIIIVAPSATYATGSLSKRLHKWTNLLSTLAHVIIVQANLGPTCLRMSMVNCADHLFNATRTKIQEVRNDCPDRPIILVGFNTGAAVACQVAEIEHVVAVVCMGFPLLTAEGRRGESDDYLLDLQHPVLFVIGQNSHRTSREDMEDLRERMRVETGLVVVGSADDYLRVSKSKKRTEGITQTIVDRCIFDEIGEFVGSVLLTPYQSVPRQPSGFINDQFNNKQNKNRMRNNSNGSSIESEPPSPQPIRRRSKAAGRPPGKKKLFQNFQGTSTSSSSSSTLSNNPQFHNPVTIPNDSHSTGLSFISKAMPGNAELNRAIQSIMPVSTTPTIPSTPKPIITSSRTVLTNSSTLSALLQTGVKPTSSVNTKPTGSGTSGLKILENITITPASAAKLPINGRQISLSSNIGRTLTGTIGNTVLLSDGTRCVRSGSNGNILRTVTTTTVPNRNSIQIQKQIGISGMTKLIPTRRQIITKARVPSESILPPPTNLTTDDIMDLPIIFADDTSLLTSENSNTEEANTPQHIVLPPKKSTASKLVVINKQIVTSAASTSSVQSNMLKRPAQPSNQPVKYAKIIVSKRQNDDKPQTLITKSSPKKFDMSSFEGIDLESELKATTVPKPMHATMKNKLDAKQFLTGSKQATINIDGKMTNVTLRVPVSISKTISSGTPSRFLYSEGNLNVDNATHVILNRTVNQNKSVMKVESVTKTGKEARK